MADRGALDDCPEDYVPPFTPGQAASLGPAPPAKLSEGAIVLWIPDPEQPYSGGPMIEGLAHGYREYYISRRTAQVRRPTGF